MAIYNDEIKVIHCDFEKEMYEPNYFRFEITSDLISKTHEDDKFGFQLRWKFTAFAVKTKDRYGSYISEQWLFVGYPNHDLDELRADIEESLRQSLIFSRNKFIQVKGRLKDIAIAEFQDSMFPEQEFVDRMLYHALHK